KTMTLKRRIAPKTVRRRSSSPTGQETKVARLARELNEAVEQQTATAGNFACHQLVARRLAAGFQGDLGECNAHLRGQIWQSLAPRGRQISHRRPIRRVA